MPGGTWRYPGIAVGCAHAHPELGVAARAVGGGGQPAAAKAASSLPVPDRTGPGRMGARRGGQHSHLSTYLPADNPPAGRAITVTQTGFMIIYEDRPMPRQPMMSPKPNPQNVRRPRLPSVRDRERS